MDRYLGRDSGGRVNHLTRKDGSDRETPGVRARECRYQLHTIEWIHVVAHKQWPDYILKCRVPQVNSGIFARDPGEREDELDVVPER
jgi:hypothetical protein